MFDISLFDVFDVLAVVSCFAFSVVLYRIGPSGTVARQLAHLMVVEGITLATSGPVFNIFDQALLNRLNESGWAFWLDRVFSLHTLGDCAMLALYPPFLAVALNTKLTRPFAGKKMRVGLAVSALLLFFVVEFSPLAVGAAFLYGVLSLVFAYSLVASVHAWRVAPAGIARNRAGVFSLAFGFRDICWGWVYGSAIYRIAIGVYNTVDDPEYVYQIYRMSTLIYIPIIAYGILRTQLFDIDLRIRWTIKQSTLAGVFVALIFLISEGASNFLEAELGNVAGLIAAAVVMFFLAPLQRFSERVATVAMPNTKNTPEYAAFRKMQVYESAISEAQQDSEISDRERALLVRLRESLGISESDAEAIERELRERLPA